MVWSRLILAYSSELLGSQTKAPSLAVGRRVQPGTALGQAEDIFEGVDKEGASGTFLAVQWLRLCASTAGDAGSIPGQGTKILHAAQTAKEKENEIFKKKEEFLQEEAPRAQGLGVWEVAFTLNHL